MIQEENLKKAQEGDLTSIEAICASTWKYIYRFIYYRVQNREEAEDITQETYARALSHFQKGNVGIDRYVGFLKTISINIIKDKWRMAKRRGANVDIEAVSPEETAIEDDAEASTQRILIENALKSLNEEQQRVIELRILRGYSVAEAAKIMNKKEGTLRTLQYRALQALAQILDKEDQV